MEWENDKQKYWLAFKHPRVWKYKQREFDNVLFTFVMMSTIRTQKGEYNKTGNLFNEMEAFIAQLEKPSYNGTGKSGTTRFQ